jgi:hypothetical protein
MSAHTKIEQDRTDKLTLLGDAAKSPEGVRVSTDSRNFELAVHLFHSGYLSTEHQRAEETGAIRFVDIGGYVTFAITDAGKQALQDEDHMIWKVHVADCIGGSAQPGKFEEIPGSGHITPGASPSWKETPKVWRAGDRVAAYQEIEIGPDLKFLYRLVTTVEATKEMLTHEIADQTKSLGKRGKKKFVQDVLKQLHALELPWPGYEILARSLQCSKSTLNEYVRNDDELRAWAEMTSLPKVEDLSKEIEATHKKRGIDSQGTVLGPVDEAAIHECEERLARRYLSGHPAAMFRVLVPDMQHWVVEQMEKHPNRWKAFWDRLDRSSATDVTQLLATPNLDGLLREYVPGLNLDCMVSARVRGKKGNRFPIERKKLSG